ncbi:hypothetical protein CPB85DRAFT_1253405 [Mucidula mucida]|nr:hypothetical protein CPB85DRAFT_1253402 [Mucidula mucida]KAF8910266.1 hypothetical protein CPB85DRAFT_1253405 [Mucidula mucida]
MPLSLSTVYSYLTVRVSFPPPPSTFCLTPAFLQNALKALIYSLRLLWTLLKDLFIDYNKGAEVLLSRIWRAPATPSIRASRDTELDDTAIPTDASNDFSVNDIAHFKRCGRHTWLRAGGLRFGYVPTKASNSTLAAASHGIRLYQCDDGQFRARDSRALETTRRPNTLLAAVLNPSLRVHGLGEDERFGVWSVSRIPATMSKILRRLTLEQFSGTHNCTCFNGYAMTPSYAKPLDTLEDDIELLWSSVPRLYNVLELALYLYFWFSDAMPHVGGRCQGFSYIKLRLVAQAEADDLRPHFCHFAWTFVTFFVPREPTGRKPLPMWATKKGKRDASDTGTDSSESSEQDKDITTPGTRPSAVIEAGKAVAPAVLEWNAQIAPLHEGVHEHPKVSATSDRGSNVALYLYLYL